MHDLPSHNLRSVGPAADGVAPTLTFVRCLFEMLFFVKENCTSYRLQELSKICNNNLISSNNYLIDSNNYLFGWKQKRTD